MARRRTVEILHLIETVNRRNQVSVIEPSMREGWNALLEQILHEANVYAGFGYYEAKDLPTGQLPGLARDAHNPEAQPQFPDESRRFYYVHPSLTRRKTRPATV